MKKIILTIILSVWMVACFTQKTQIKDFQRYRLGTVKSFIEKDNSREKLKEFKTKAYSLGGGHEALVYYSFLLGFDTEVRYQFFNEYLISINFKTDCHLIKKTLQNKGQSNTCTTQTLREFFKIKAELNELLGSSSRCVGCEVCYTKSIEIPKQYSEEFEQKLTSLSLDYPDNYTICESWKDYTNNSTVNLTYDITSGWFLWINEVDK